MADVTQATLRDERSYGVNEVRLQHRLFYVEAGVLAQNDTIEITHPDAATEGAFPVASYTVYAHDGGAEATTPVADADDDTLVLEFINPHEQDIELQRDTDPGPPNYVEVVHVLAGVTGGAATATEIAASLNADADFLVWGYAAALAATTLGIFPRGVEGHVRLGVGSTADALAAALGAAVTNDARTLVEEPAADWTLTYTPADGKALLTYTAAAAETKIIAAVSYF